MPRKPIETATERQAEVVEAIDSYAEQNGYPPTVKELAELLGISTTSAHERIAHLVQKGYLAKVPGKARSLVVKKRPSNSA